MSRPVVCAIGTTDPWNAAGLGLEARILWECGARPVTVVTAVSAQDAAGVHGLYPLPADAIVAQWRALRLAGIGTVHIGALCSAEAVHAVTRILVERRLDVVYDPALRATRGGRFADEATLAVLREHLIPLASVCTPNMDEAAALCGIPVRTVDDMEGAAHALRACGAAAVLVTGGHLAGDPIDVFAHHAECERFVAPRIERAMRGTGGVLSAAIAAELAQGRPLRDAVLRARVVVRAKIAGAVSAGDFNVAD